MRKPVYKDRQMNLIVEACIAGFHNPDSEFYHNGEPRRTAGHRCYFWNGYSGNGHDAPSGSLGHAAYMACKYCRAQEDK